MFRNILAEALLDHLDIKGTVALKICGNCANVAVELSQILYMQLICPIGVDLFHGF